MTKPTVAVPGIHRQPCNWPRKQSEAADTAAGAEFHFVCRKHRREIESGKQEGRKADALPAPFLFSCFPDLFLLTEQAALRCIADLRFADVTSCWSSELLGMPSPNRQHNRLENYRGPPLLLAPLAFTNLAQCSARVGNLDDFRIEQATGSPKTVRAMAASGLGKGLGSLLAEPAGKPLIRPSVRGVGLVMRSETIKDIPWVERTEKPHTIPLEIAAKVVGFTPRIDRWPLFFWGADAALMALSFWIAVVSPLAGSVAAMVVSGVLTLVGSGLGCAALLLRRG